VNSGIFFAWITPELLPKLPLKNVTIMDNSSFHKRLDIQEAIRHANHTLRFLPAYLLQLNPIEYKWAQAKAI
jgi:transposase